jgi:hypothetical protein
VPGAIFSTFNSFRTGGKPVGFASLPSLQALTFLLTLSAPRRLLPAVSALRMFPSSSVRRFSLFFISFSYSRSLFTAFTADDAIQSYTTEVMNHFLAERKVRWWLFLLELDEEAMRN